MGAMQGMVHMCQMLVERFPDQYKMIVMEQPQYPPQRNGLLLLLDKVCNNLSIENDGNPLNHYKNHIFKEKLLALCEPMFKSLKEGDEVFLLEYLTFNAPQYELACYIKRAFPFIRIYALTHLTVISLKKYQHFIGRNLIKKWAKPVDKMLTLGTSLSYYLESCGIDKSKISTGFHYVDLEYYNKKEPLEVHQPIRVITMGAMKRNYALLADIVKKCPDVNWTICRGNNRDIDAIFKEYNNVSLKGFLNEDELKHQMDLADISINVMEDTIGSNVITTSLAMGLAMVVSDVGSIRDYTDDTNALFCSNDEGSFRAAINLLAHDKEKVLQMKKSSINLSKRLNISSINEWFSSLH